MSLPQGSAVQKVRSGQSLDGPNEASPQQAAGYQTEGHCRGDTTVSPPSSLCKVTSEQAPRNLLIEVTWQISNALDLLRGHRGDHREAKSTRGDQPLTLAKLALVTLVIES
jgi:hypothetical protein